MYVNSTYFIPSSVLVLGHLVNFRFSSLCVELFYFGFNLHLLITNEVRNPPFSLFIGHLYVLFSELSSAFADFPTECLFFFNQSFKNIYARWWKFFKVPSPLNNSNNKERKFKCLVRTKDQVYRDRHMLFECMHTYPAQSLPTEPLF